jgi:dihydrofolate reductase
MPLSLIVAMTRDGIIGRGGTLPWRLSADLKRFKSLTMGHHLLMGRKTFDSLPLVLPGRTSIVISRQETLSLPDGVKLATSLEQALLLATGDDSPFIIGGAEIYALSLPRIERMHVTWVEADVPGDTRFPGWNSADWKMVAEARHTADAKNEYDYTFAMYERAQCGVNGEWS